MTTNDRMPYPAEEPDRIGQMFGEVFDLIDETVAGVSDVEVDERLREVLADAGHTDPDDLDRLGQQLMSQGRDVSPLDLARLAESDEAYYALQAAWEQVAITRAAVAAAHREAEQQLAMAFEARRQAAVLSGLGRRDEALAPSQEATDLYQRLAEANPAAYLPDLAASLNNLGIWLSGLGRRDEALAPSQEAVTIRRRLAEANPAAHLPDLAMSLWAFAWVRVRIGLELPEALVAVEEAVSLYKPLVDQLPNVLPQLWSAYHTLADVLDGLDRSAEAADLRRQLAEAAGDPPDRDGSP